MKAPDTKLAVTLYNLREHCQNKADLDKTLGKVKDIGYQAIQISGIGDISPEEVKELLDKYQLYVCATHEGLDNLKNRFDEIVAKMKLWGCEFTALGFPGDDCWSKDGVMRLVKDLDEIGARFKAEGLKFGYHNHHHEFEHFTGRPMLAEIYENTEPSHVYGELDVAWAVRGGADPVDWIHRLKGRMPVIHLKDFRMVKAELELCEIGEGNLNWPTIIKACQETDIPWYSIEQDSEVPGRDIFESIRISFENLKKMGVK